MEQYQLQANEGEAKIINAASQMKKDGMLVNLIAKYTGLTPEKVESL